MGHRALQTGGAPRGMARGGRPASRGFITISEEGGQGPSRPPATHGRPIPMAEGRVGVEAR